MASAIIISSRFDWMTKSYKITQQNSKFANNVNAMWLGCIPSVPQTEEIELSQDDFQDSSHILNHFNEKKQQMNKELEK